MRHRNTLNFALILCCSLLISLSSDFQVQAQSEIIEKPKIKDFGSSIKPKKKKKKEEVETNNGQSKKSDEDDDVIKIDTRLVRTDILVVDRKGKAVRGLKADDFIITEDSVLQEIGTFSIGENVEVPKSIVLIIDYSGSQMPYIRNSIEAAKILINKLNPKDRMAIVTDNVEVLKGFTNDKKQLKQSLDRITQKIEISSLIEKDIRGLTLGKSYQYSALMATLNEMFDEEDVRPMVIFQTDGDQAFDIKRPETKEERKGREVLAWGKTTNFTVAELFSSIEKSRATIYSVITGIPLLGLSPEEQNLKIQNMFGWDKKNTQFFAGFNARAQKAMSIVSRASGGTTQIFDRPSQAETIYSNILNDMNNRYLLGFYPKNEARDGKKRTVKIEVKGHPEYVITGRKTYIVPELEK